MKYELFVYPHGNIAVGSLGRYQGHWALNFGECSRKELRHLLQACQSDPTVEVYGTKGLAAGPDPIRWTG